MEENENFPFLKCIRKPSQAEFDNLQKIDITSQSFTIGRGLKNSIVIPFLSISRTHCTLKKIQSHWYIEDNSTFGIEINKTKLGKGKSRNLSQDDIISLEPSGEFIFKFIDQSMSNDDFEIPKKRMKMEKPDNNNKILNDVKMKFEESQSYEIKHIEDKIQNAKQMQTTSMILKEQLQSDMNRKLDNLQSEFALQIENLKGEKNEVEKQKALLIEERDAQLANVKNEMESKIAELLAQIQKHNESETELLNENNSLKEKLWKEREEFLSELDRESTSKQEMLEKLESKIREQEEVRLKEKQELETLLKMETEQLRYAKEKELKELEEQKKLREKELQQELENIKKNLQIQMEQTEQEKVKAEQLLNEKIEQMKKFSTEEKAKIEQFELERKEMEKKHHEVEINAQKSLKELKDRVMERETQLAALAAERIEKQAEQSSEVISTLQEQLERVKKQLRDVETEKNTLLENICVPEAGEGTSKQTTLTEVGELMESELQCSICAELFVSAITLNCSHTFCKYCITMWKKKKMDCPICRSTIMSECKSLVLDTFIEKMVQNLTEEMKVKRQEMLKYREELVRLARQTSAGSGCGSDSFDESYQDSNADPFEYFERAQEEEEQEYEELFEDYSPYTIWHDNPRTFDFYELYDYDPNSGSDDSPTDDDDDADSERGGRRAGARRAAAGGAAAGRAAAGRAAAGVAAAGGAAAPSAAPAARGAAPSADAPAATAPNLQDSTSTERGSNADGGGERRRRQRRRRGAGTGRVGGVPGSYFGGYGRCYSCGARGHWAPGCPFR